MWCHATYRQLSQVNFSAATQRKTEELHGRQEQLEKEREVLIHNKTEWVKKGWNKRNGWRCRDVCQFVSLWYVSLSRLMLGCINRFEKRRDISKSLQEEWSRSARLKHQREEEERRFLRCVDQGSPHAVHHHPPMHLHIFASWLSIHTLTLKFGTWSDWH